MAVTSTVGGVTSGYWATGSVKTATPPASTKTTERTMAKTGRSMKNREITADHLRPEYRNSWGKNEPDVERTIGAGSSDEGRGQSGRPSTPRRRRPATPRMFERH